MTTAIHMPTDVSVTTPIDYWKTQLTIFVSMMSKVERREAYDRLYALFVEYSSIRHGVERVQTTEFQAAADMLFRCVYRRRIQKIVIEGGETATADLVCLLDEASHAAVRAVDHSAELAVTIVDVAMTSFPNDPEPRESLQSFVSNLLIRSCAHEHDDEIAARAMVYLRRVAPLLEGWVLRQTLFVCLMLASKMADDESMMLFDWASIFDSGLLQRPLSVFQEWEIALLKCLKWDLGIPWSELSSEKQRLDSTCGIS